MRLLLGISFPRLPMSGLLLGLILLAPSEAASQQANAASSGTQHRPGYLQTSCEPFPAALRLQDRTGRRRNPWVDRNRYHRHGRAAPGSPPGLVAAVGDRHPNRDLPLLAKDPINAGNPNGNYLYEIGDADAQALYVYSFDKRWAAGFGARVIAPTGWDALSSGKWQAMPIAGFRYALPELSPGSFLEPFARYDVSFAGDPSKRNISNLQLAPYFNLNLPNRWFVSFYPSADIRVNFGDPVAGQTGRLFLPFDARVGRNLTDHMALSLEVGVPIIKDYPVYNFKTELRLNTTF